jgi:hypothetical protein
VAAAFRRVGRVDGVRGYHDISRHHRERRILTRAVPLGCPILANAELFHNRVVDAVASSSTPVLGGVTAEPVTSVDVTAADVLPNSTTSWPRQMSSCALRR